MTSCRCGNIAVYRVTKRGLTIPSECGQFCNICLRKDSWYAIHYFDYKIEQIQYDAKTCTYNVVHTPSDIERADKLINIMERWDRMWRDAKE